MYRSPLKSSQYTQIKTLKPRLKFCVSCRVKLIFKYKQDVKTVFCLDRTLLVTRWAYKCPSSNCKKYGKSILAARMGLKNHSVGYDLLAEIGFQRVNEKKTLLNIQKYLLDEFGIKISEKQISNLADKYLQLIGNKVHETDLENLRSRGNVVISIDGVCPQKANTTLYLIREVVSGKILLARVIVNSATQYIAALYYEIKEMGLPIVGIISDKQASLRLGAREVFPEIPHQYCQFHYLRNISKDFEDNDRRLRKDIRKAFRGIYNTTKTMDVHVKKGDCNGKEYEKLKELFEILKASSRISPHYPFKAVGIQLYRHVIIFEKAIKIMKKKSDLMVLKTIADHLSAIISNFEAEYKLRNKQDQEIRKIAKLLKSKYSREDAEKQFSAYVSSIRKSKGLKEWVIDVQKQTKAWIGGLFAFANNANIPRTNNALEQYIRMIKGDFTRILNRKFIHRFFLRRSEFWVFARELNVPSENIQILQNCKNGELICSKQRFEELSLHFRLERGCVKNFKKMVAGVVKDWILELD